MMENESPDYLEQEIEFIKKNFDLDEIILFQKYHQIEIYRLPDWQYGLRIDRDPSGCHAVELTPLGALVMGIKKYKKEHGE